MDVIMPQLGETVSEGTVSVWHSKIGDAVSTKQPLFDVSSDKVEMEVPAPAEGTLVEICVDAGTTVPVGEVIAIIVREGEVIEAKAAAPVAVKAEAKILRAEAAPARAVSARAANRDARNQDSRGNPLSPAVRRLVAENGLDPAAISGSGANGRIKKKDVLAHLGGWGAKRPAPLAMSGDEDEIIPFSNLRRLTAEHMVRSKATSPHVLQAVEADFARVARARESVSNAWKKREGFSLTWLPFIAKAVCEAIREFPRVNGAINGDNLIVYRRVNLAIAVDLNFDGLVPR